MHSYSYINYDNVRDTCPNLSKVYHYFNCRDIQINFILVKKKAFIPSPPKITLNQDA